MRILVLMLCLVVLAGCREPQTVDAELLQERGDLSYLPNETEPYAGKVTTAYSSGQLKSEQTWVFGEKHRSIRVTPD
jgi:hypothetical protein